MKFKKWFKRVSFSSLIVIFFVVLGTIFLVQTSGDPGFKKDVGIHVINDITELNPIEVQKIIKPLSTQEISDVITQSTGPISIGGGKFSQGGQTGFENSIHIDMRSLNKILDLDVKNKTIVVQAGITWRQIQEVIDKEDLSIKIMQSYANFTVGGSLSVNVHGRYIGQGPIISSVRWIKLVMADGSVKKASRTENTELFKAAIGGYGGIGVIAEASLDLESNRRLERRNHKLKISEYKDYFFKNIRNSKEIVFHNVDIYLPDCEKGNEVSYYKTDKPVTVVERLVPVDRQYKYLPTLISIVESLPFGHGLREFVIDPWYYSEDQVIWRNWEASKDVRELGEPDRSKETHVLQEYFVPVENFYQFVPQMCRIFKDQNVDVANVSIRHARSDKESILSWARKEVFAFVVYYKQKTTEEAKAHVKEWTRQLVDVVLKNKGTYYLPYQIHPTPKQFHKAYPRAEEFFLLKAKVDPDYRFQNKLWDAYYESKEQDLAGFLKSLKGYKKPEDQTFLSFPEWYLVWNPLEYAQMLGAGKNPSDFPFFLSIDEYWKIFDRVVYIAESLYPKNEEYQTMLWVIGCSTTAEFMVKGLYESTLGRLTAWLSGYDTPEDQFIANAHKDYAQFLFNEPWYRFPFLKYLKRFWNETPVWEGAFLRKIDRRFLFTTEYLGKALYAELIRMATESQYGVSVGHQVAVVRSLKNHQKIDSRIEILKSFDDGTAVIQMPRWGGFTELVPKMALEGVEFLEVSGNRNLVLTAVGETSFPEKISQARLIFNSLVTFPKNHIRRVYLVRMDDLNEVLEQIKNTGYRLEHLYDY